MHDSEKRNVAVKLKEQYLYMYELQLKKLKHTGKKTVKLYTHVQNLNLQTKSKTIYFLEETSVLKHGQWTS